MLLQCPCGGIVRCNGLFDGRTTSLRNFSDQPDPISHQRRDPSTLATSATTIAITSPHRRADGRYPSQVRRSSSPSCSSMTSLRGTFHHHRLTVERFAVQRRARRTSGSLMLLQCPCGGIVRCNGLFDGRTTNPRYFSDQANPISHQRRDSTTSVTSAATIAHRKPASPA
jgi:hypothetical protein